MFGVELVAIKLRVDESLKSVCGMSGWAGIRSMFANQQIPSGGLLGATPEDNKSDKLYHEPGRLQKSISSSRRGDPRIFQ